MSAKFQTFAYNSRTVGSNYMKFEQQFEIIELYVCTKFRGNRSRDFGFRTRKPPRKFGVQSGLSQKRLKYGKTYFIRLYILRYPFISTNPLLAAMRFFPFFSFFFLFFPFLSFFFRNFCTLFVLLNHKTSKSNFCVELLSCKCNFFSRSFLGQLHWEPPQNGAPKHQFFEWLKLKCYFFFDISRYLTDKYFDIVWGCHPPPGTPQTDPQKSIFEWLKLKCYFFLISVDI